MINVIELVLFYLIQVTCKLSRITAQKLNRDVTRYFRINNKQNSNCKPIKNDLNFKQRFVVVFSSSSFVVIVDLYCFWVSIFVQIVYIHHLIISNECRVFFCSFFDQNDCSFWTNGQEQKKNAVNFHQNVAQLIKSIFLNWYIGRWVLTANMFHWKMRKCLIYGDYFCINIFL